MVENIAINTKKAVFFVVPLIGSKIIITLKTYIDFARHEFDEGFHIGYVSVDNNQVGYIEEFVDYSEVDSVEDFVNDFEDGRVNNSVDNIVNEIIGL